MNQPPKKLDGAQVIEWAWSGSKPFGNVQDTSGKLTKEIFGLAICQYLNSETVYVFSCDRSWEVVQDSDFSSVDEAKSYLPEQYRTVPVSWMHG
ncbi:hypothetical protein V3H21_22310 [Vibrio parahaemolyticus]|uniref:hypothetical protein n=1 Tax=Vibrio TaxID=662 RepID=UPI0011201DEB|nr:MULTISPECIES: hypothetical protein [Vibrio]EJC6747125.1 hypothetical protein [Vibrio vulnificus]EJC6822301.1 hypothetical protein [Vibrio vulnificus]EJC6955973.1 hypothetical protein [Vibrio vulnificus]EJC6960570.1 hypothetical protein [Vibrio vulnificus]EKQ3696922.1 hypothetical protein [Vibrio vulnificus]